MTYTGRVMSVETRNAAEPTVAAAAIGDTILYVNDASTFDEAGGTVMVLGSPLAYSAINVDDDSLTLATALTVAVDDQELVEVYPASPVKTALVSLDDNGDHLEVVVPQTLLDKFVDGTRDEATAESVTLERRGAYEWLIADAPAKPLEQTSLDYVEGEEGIGLSESVAQVQDLNALGQVSASGITVDSISLGGVDLQTQLGASSIGKLVSARLPAQASNIAITTTNTKVFELNCGTVTGGRTYRVSTALLLDGTAPFSFGDRILFEYRYTIDGTTPTTASAEMDGGFDDNSYQSGDLTAVRPEAEIDIATTSQLRIALCVRYLTGSGSYSIYALAGSARSRPTMALYDDGPSGARQDSAITLTGGGISRFVKTYNATWAYGISGRDGSITYDSYFYVGGENDFCGFVGFDSASMVAQLANASTPVSCVLRWRPRSRQTSAGLDVKLATHNLASSFAANTAAGGLPAFAYPNAAAYGLTLLSNVRNNGVPGTSYDESLGTTVFNQFKAGSRKGIGFLGTPEASQVGGEGTVYGDGAYQCQLIFTYDGTS